MIETFNITADLATAPGEPGKRDPEMMQRIKKLLCSLMVHTGTYIREQLTEDNDVYNDPDVIENLQDVNNLIHEIIPKPQINENEKNEPQVKRFVL